MACPGGGLCSPNDSSFMFMLIITKTVTRWLLWSQIINAFLAVYSHLYRLRNSELSRRSSFENREQISGLSESCLLAFHRKSQVAIVEMCKSYLSQLQRTLGTVWCRVECCHALRQMRTCCRVDITLEIRLQIGIALPGDISEE